MYPHTRQRTSSSTLGAAKGPAHGAKSANGVKKSLSKPAWDSTVSDLNQMKPTKEDLEKRKTNLTSKNKDVIKFEKIKQEMLKSKNSNLRLSDSQARLALIQQILYDDEQLKRLIDKSDSTIKQVKDLFNEDTYDAQSVSSANMKAAKINLTLAPNVKNLNESILPIDVNKPKEQKSNECASEVKVNVPNAVVTPTLSDLESLEKINKLKNELENYQKLLMIKLNTDNSTQEKLLQPQSQPQVKPNSNQEIRDEKQEQQIQQPPRLNSFSSTTFSTLNDEVRKAITELENKLNELENSSTCKQSMLTNIPVATQSRQQSAQTSTNASSSSSYTLVLIKIVSTLCDYVRDACNELNYEKLKQAELNKQLDIHRKLIDGLTNEIMCVKEQNQKIINDYVNQNAKIEAEFDQIKIYLRSTMLFAPVSQHQPVAATSSLYNQKPHTSAFTVKPAMRRADEDDESQPDKFAERLTAMLNADTMTATTTNLYPTRPFYSSQPQLLVKPTTAQSDLLNAAVTTAPNQQQPFNAAALRPTSAIEVSTNLNLRPSDMHQKRLSTTSQSQQSQMIEANGELKAKNETLEKLQRERQLVKEQLSRLSKERQAVEHDLEELSRNSATPCSSDSNELNVAAVVKNPPLVPLSSNASAATTKRLTSLNLNCGSPNLSPISPQNVYQDTRN